jgi:hypothetical protein
VLERDPLVEPVEQPLAATEHVRRDDDREIIDLARGQRLADESSAAHQVIVLAAGRLLGEP